MKNFSLVRTIENFLDPRKFKIARAEKFIRCQRSTLVSLMNGNEKRENRKKIL